MNVFDEFASRFGWSSDDTDDIELNLGTYQRRVVIILLDTSGSMGFEQNGGRPIDALNEKLRSWIPEVRRKAKGSLRGVEFAIVTFGGDGVRTVTGPAPADARSRDEALAADGGAFVMAGDLAVPELPASGTTPLVEALEFALWLGDRRVEHLAREHGLQTGQVRMILFSDGTPNDGTVPAGSWNAVVDLVGARGRARRLVFLAFGAPGADEEMLRELAPDNGYFPLPDFDFSTLLDLILVATSADDPFTAVLESAERESDTPAGDGA